jgi:hypothetical protein
VPRSNSGTAVEKYGTPCITYSSPETVENRGTHRSVVAFYQFVASPNISIGYWRTEITFNEFPPSSFETKFVFICFVAWVDIIPQ